MHHFNTHSMIIYKFIICIITPSGIQVNSAQAELQLTVLDALQPLSPELRQSICKLAEMQTEWH